MAGKLIIGAALALALMGGAAFAKGIVDTVVDGLRAQGYDQIDVSTTLLGRTRIEAIKGEYHREIVINPTTGEILRDYCETADGVPVSPLQIEDMAGESDIEADDDDSSGSGSGSGSGSSGSGSGSSGGSGGSGSGSNSGSSGGSGSGSNSGSSGGSGSSSGSGSSGSSGGSGDDD